MKEYKLILPKRKKTKVCEHVWLPKNSYRPTFTTEEIVDKVYCIYCLKTKTI